MNEKNKYPSDEAERFQVRFTKPGMRQIIADAAEKNGRSMNAEINARLEQSFGEPLSKTYDREMDAFFEKLEQKIAKYDDSVFLDRLVENIKSKLDDDK